MTNKGEFSHNFSWSFFFHTFCIEFSSNNNDIVDKEKELTSKYNYRVLTWILKLNSFMYSVLCTQTIASL